MICEICYEDRQKGDVLELESKAIFACNDCQSYLTLDGCRVQGGFMVVPVKAQSLQRVLKELIYVRPWRRRAKHCVFLAFYHNESVLYVGKVKSISLKTGRDEVINLLPKGEGWASKEFYTFYALEYIAKLKKPILRGGCSPVQSKLTVPFKKFVKAKTVCDLR